MRYQVIEGSQSAHCCFDFTVVDVTKPLIIAGEQYRNEFESVCECFDEAAAKMICDALNKEAHRG